MRKCPVCDAVSQGLVCENCGFDGSMDYEKHPTFCAILADKSAISLRRENWRFRMGNRLNCAACGSGRFEIHMDGGVILCYACGKRISEDQKRALMAQWGILEKRETEGHTAKGNAVREEKGRVRIVLKDSANPLAMANGTTYQFKIDTGTVIKMIAKQGDVIKDFEMPCGSHTVDLSVFSWMDPEMKSEPSHVVKAVQFVIHPGKVTNLIANRPFAKQTLTVNYE